MARSRPNIVYIFADEWRAQATGYAGDVNCDTPNLDRLAEQSVSLDAAVAGCPVCCPARASILTGLYPLSHGVFINDVELDPSLPSIATIFGQAGYQTGYIGKWHVYGSPDGHYGRRHSFVPRDYQLGFDYWKGFECTHDYNDSYYFFNDDPTPRKWEGYDAFPQAEDAAAYIADHAGGEEPFLLMLSWGPPHFPLHTAPEEYRERYQNREIELRPNLPEHRRDLAIKELRGYYAHIAALDDALKVVLDAVDRAGIAEDTILVFTSDHGDMRQSQGLRTKLFPWDESVRVPFLVRWRAALSGATRRGEPGAGPDVAPPGPGSRLQVPIDTPDHLPTLLGLAGLDVPDTLEGRDWSPVLRGEETLGGDEAALLMMAAQFTELCQTDIPPYRGLRTPGYTYVRTRSEPWLLYDNQADAYQMNNLVGDPASREVREELDRRLWARLDQLRDGFEDGRILLEKAGLTHYKEVHFPVETPWRDPWK